MSTNDISSIWSTGWTTELITGTWRSQRPVHLNRPSPCFIACPIGENIPHWMQALQDGEPYKAWELVTEVNPFPAVCGRVCQHPCEKECNRSTYDSAVNINALERWLGDSAIQKGWEFTPPARELSQRVVVIGGGPAGMSCAYQLRLRGFQVLLYEGQSEAGGMLRYGIPSYRLPKDILSAEVERLKKIGVDFRLNNLIELQSSLPVMASQNDAVFLSPGASVPKKLPQGFTSCQDVWDGIGFLLQINSGARPRLGKKVAVAGGGNTAIDVSRSAIRLGTEVYLITLETRDAMPASSAEIEEALEEGVHIYNETVVTGLNTTGNCLNSLSLQRVKFSGTENNPLAYEVKEGENFALKVDSLVVAIGQESCLDKITDLPVLKNVFVGGDAISEQRTVAMAIGAGRKAAEEIANYLLNNEGLPSEKNPLTNKEVVSNKEINHFYFPVLERASSKKVAPVERDNSFDEVVLSLDTCQVEEEIRRCFICGRCVSCDNCYYFCPDMAVKRPRGNEDFYQAMEQYCKGCGVCVEECPRGAVVMKEEKIWPNK